MRFAVTLLSLTAVAVVATAGGVVPPLFLLPPRPDADGNPLPPEAVRRLGTSKFLVGNAKKLLYSTDGKTVYAGEEFSYWPFDIAISGLSAWDVATGKLLWRCPVKLAVAGLSRSDDGKLVWVAGWREGKGDDVTEWLEVSAADGHVIAAQQIGNRPVNHVPISQSGRLAIHTSVDLKVLEQRKKEPVLTVLPPPGERNYLYTADLTLDGNRVVVVDSLSGSGKAFGGNPLRCLDVKTGKQLWKVDWEPAANDAPRVSISADGKTVCSLIWYGHQARDAEGKARLTSLRVWDLDTGKVLYTHAIAPPQVQVNGPLAYTPDSKRCLLSVGGRVSLFDLTGGKVVREYPDLDASGGFAFSPDGKTLAHGGRSLSFVGTATGKLRDGSPEPYDDTVEQIRFTGDSSRVFLYRGRRDEWCFDLRTGKRLERRAAPGNPPGLSDQSYTVNDAAKAVSPNGVIQAANYWNDKLEHDHADQGKILLTVLGKPTEAVRELPAGTGWYEEMVFSGDGRLLLARNEGNIYAWDVAKDEKPSRFATTRPESLGLSSLGHFLHPSPDGRFVAFHSLNSEDGEGKWVVSVHSLPDGTEAKRFTGAGNLRHLSWSTDGDRFAGGGCVRSRRREDPGVLFLGDTRAGRTSRELRLEREVGGVALTPDGRTAAAGVGSEVQLWEVESGTVRHTFTGLRAAGGKYGFSPDGRYLVTDTPDGTLVWDVRGELQRFAKPDADELERGWAALAADAPAAFDAIRLLAAYPAESLPFLKRKVAEAKGMSAERIAKLIEQLGDQDFRTREAAEKELLANLDDARAAVEKAATSAAPEVQERAGRLAKKPIAVTPERLRLVRAVEAAEWVSDKDAVLLLRKWATDGPAVLRTEADAALKRLKK